MASRRKRQGVKHARSRGQGSWRGRAGPVDATWSLQIGNFGIELVSSLPIVCNGRRLGVAIADCTLGTLQQLSDRIVYVSVSVGSPTGKVFTVTDTHGSIRTLSGGKLVPGSAIVPE